MLSESSRNIVACFLPLRTGKQPACLSLFEDLAKEEECGLVADTRSLVHGVCHNNDGLVAFERFHKLLDLFRGNGIQGACGFVHEDYFRFHGDGAGDAEALLLTA